jgi:DNA (cytosine-5)-methyltransferase 1
MKVLDLFAGIGGFTLGLERAGFETVAFCEIEPYAQKVLKKHWPGVPIYDDVRQLTAERLASDGIGVDVITGGFPCQDISTAGRQAGIDGERSGLWSEIARLISELQPRYAIMENVTNLVSGDSGRWFGRVLGDLAEIGYDAEWHCIPASAIGAHHHRDRVWIVAYPNSNGESVCSVNAGEICKAALLAHPSSQYRRDNTELAANQTKRTESAINLTAICEDVADTNGAQRERGRLPIRIQQKHSNTFLSSWWEAEPDVGRVADGVPARSHRLKCLGNAVVPQIPELIGRAIMEFEDDRNTAL